MIALIFKIVINSDLECGPCEPINMMVNVVITSLVWYLHSGYGFQKDSSLLTSHLLESGLTFV
jgi:hypothetical protein